MRSWTGVVARFFTLVVILMGVTLTSVSAANPAAMAKEIPIEVLFKHAQYRNLSLSPDKKFLAAITPYKDRLNISVIDLEKKTVDRVTNLTTYDVAEFHWVDDERIVFTTTNAQSLEKIQLNGGFFVVNKDGSGGKTLIPPIVERNSVGVFRHTSFVRRLPDNPDYILVEANDRSYDSLDLYRMNIKNGRKTLITSDSPGRVAIWGEIGADLVAKWALGNSDIPGEQILYWKPQGKWEVLRRWGTDLKNVMIPVAQMPGGERWLVACNDGRDTTALYEFDLKTQKLGRLVYEDPRYDVYPVDPASINEDDAPHVFFEDTERQDGKVLGVRYYKDKSRTVWFDDVTRKTVESVAANFPGLSVGFDPTQKKSIVTVGSASAPSKWFLFDQENGKVEELVAANPALDDYVFAEVKPVSFTARDGLPLNGYLTLPAQYKPGKPVPLILHPHGGPWHRDEWVFNKEVQFMANLGYAVLQVNFRGSTGYGTKHMVASYKQWGDTMIDDMTDGVRWAIKEGYADPNKIGVYGASYGGYATLMSMVKEPDLYKAGINYVGVTDMFVHQDTQPAQKHKGDFREIAKILNGDSSTDKTMFERTSPTYHVDRIKGPVFHAYGGQDRNVDPANWYAIKSAFNKAGKPLDYMFEPEEAHGYFEEAHTFAFYHKMKEFWQKNLPLTP